MCDETKINELVKAAVLAGLDGVEFLQEFDDEELCREYNGIGPEWAGAKVRGLATRYLGLFEPAALIHDLRNYASDGSRFRFNYANMEFLENCRKLADAEYAWYDWRRYRARAIAHFLYDFVAGPGGWTAWADCNARRIAAKGYTPKTKKGKP